MMLTWTPALAPQLLHMGYFHCALAYIIIMFGFCYSWFKLLMLLNSLHIQQHSIKPTAVSKHQNTSASNSSKYQATLNIPEERAYGEFVLYSVVEAFVEAWKHSSVDGICQCYSCYKRSNSLTYWRVEQKPLLILVTGSSDEKCVAIFE